MFGWDDEPDLNITPLVDVMLVLMAILMVTAPTIVYKEKIDLPKGSRTTKAVEKKALVIRMDIQKRIYLGSDTFDYETFADEFMRKSATYDKNREVYIRADKKLKYEEVIYLLKSVKEAGFGKVSLVTS